MNRILPLALGIAMIAGAANAMDIRVNTAGKSDAEVRLLVRDAAHKACKLEYNGDYFADYKRDGCERDTVRATFEQVRAAREAAARTTTSRDVVVAGR